MLPGSSWAFPYLPMAREIACGAACGARVAVHSAGRLPLPRVFRKVSVAGSSDELASTATSM